MSAAPIQLHARDWEAGFVAPGFPIPPIGKLLGARLESHDPAAGVLRVSYETRAEYANPAGAVMGGIVASFLDDTMGPLIVAATGAEKFPVTLDLHTTYFKPVPIGPRAMVEARVDRIGASAAFTSAEIRDASGALLARAIQTALLRPAS
ncbi:MAG: PaaI family thioesterase [Hyphomonadaceae bacterium]|nr:PaaI family thioesterase [Hyphomonadaceae bacterium]